jgi:Putative Flp pilus-assembly TadE/G-like
MTIFGSFLARFARNERGNVAVMFGVSLIPMMGAASLAIDMSSGSNAKSAIQSELDAAALDVMRAAVKIQTDPTKASLSASARQALIDTQVAAILDGRRPLASSKASGSRMTDFSMTGSWANSLKTEYKVDASFKLKRFFALNGVGSTTLPVAASATARMEVTTETKTTVPTLDNPGYEAGDYNRIYAYCYNDKNKNNPDKGRTQMTPVSSNGTDGGNGAKELNTNSAFSAVLMPSCSGDEILSWRLYNVRGQRTNKNSWPTDTYNSTTKLYTQTDKSGVQIYNHYSDTMIDPLTGKEVYAFQGNAFNFNQPIRMMETVVCDTKDQCTPGKPGNIIPSGKNRNPVQQNQACAPGKFIYQGWEDRPFLPKNAALNDYSSNNSNEWTDSDYDDITLVISCPETTIKEYKSKIALIK